MHSGAGPAAEELRPERSGGVSRSLQQAVHLDPEGPPLVALGLRQGRQGGDVADAGQVGVHSPVVQGPAARGGVGVELLAVQRQVGPEPVQGPAPELGAGRLIGRRVIVAPPATGQRRGAGGVVAAGGRQIVGELRVGLERLGPAPGGGGVTLRGVENRGQGQALGVVRGAVVASEDSRQAVGEGGELLGPGDPLGRRIAPVGPLRAELVSYAELGQ